MNLSSPKPSVLTLLFLDTNQMDGPAFVNQVRNDTVSWGVYLTGVAVSHHSGQLVPVSNRCSQGQSI